ncbi:thermonuclease family protein [Prochlorococcus sp. MIT 0604]|uniref:thermonuclease family protein n=1 Tax=Prochlorococcus sp. MIT 0604 TaxID=1501268 RepID=UPI0004F661F9|nr:thermonuclease family protein [Prochlorococcus sp. MIT 0604]AIQ95744.1 nuclease [Prochlorococcus sp. MIT 0604]
MSPFLVIFLVISFSSEAYSALPTTIIKSCYDGDTCTTTDGEKIRLACIDTPELKGKRAEPATAKEARDFLNNLMSNKKVSIRRITNDRYGRTVGELFINGINVQEVLVQKGYGKIYERYADQCKWTKEQ